MTKLSVAIIAHNEAGQIRDCLASVTWADEVVVVDAISTDETVAICRQFPVRVLQQAWLGFAAQKNLAIQATTHDWVLSLDADERVTPALREEIRGLMQSGPTLNGYAVPRKSYFGDRWIRYGGWYPDYSLRLFNKHQGRVLSREVHEAVTVTGSTGHLRAPLEHYTYTGVADYLERMGRYSTLAARELVAQGRRFRPLDLVARPCMTFFRMYILQQGFRDGAVGLVLAGLYAAYTFSKYAKLWEADARAREGPPRAE